MTMLWMDGFEGFTDGGGKSTLIPVYSYFSSTGSGDVGVQTPGRGEKNIWMNEGGSEIGNPEMHFITPPASTNSTWIVGFAVYVNNPIHRESTFLVFRDSAFSQMVSITNRSGTFQAHQGNLNAALYSGGLATVSIPTAHWYYFECKIYFHNTAGTITIRVNEEEVMAATGLDTVRTGTAEDYATSIGFGGSNHSMPVRIDDLYICDGAGSSNNDFLGDGAVKRLKANGNGTTNDFLGSDGNSTDNYLLVDDDDPDGDTTYAGSGTSTERDLYAMENCPSTPASIACVSVVSYGKKTDSGSVSPSHLVVSNGTDSSLESITPEETYGHLYSLFPTDPDTATAWTESGVNAMQAGVEIA